MDSMKLAVYKGSGSALLHMLAMLCKHLYLVPKHFIPPIRNMGTAFKDTLYVNFHNLTAVRHNILGFQDLWFLLSLCIAYSS